MSRVLVAARVVEVILRTVDDPAGWLVAARRIAETAGLRPERCIPTPVTLQNLGYALAEEADKQTRLNALREAAEAFSRQQGGGR